MNEPWLYQPGELQADAFRRVLAGPAARLRRLLPGAGAYFGFNEQKVVERTLLREAIENRGLALPDFKIFAPPKARMRTAPSSQRT